MSPGRIFGTLVLAGALAGCNTARTSSIEPALEGVTSYSALPPSPTSVRISRTTGRNKVAPQYFVEFRSRYALSYGHTFLAHGRLGPNGEVGQLTADRVAGLHPAGDSPIPWMIGHAVPVPSETGPSDGDLEDEYVSARFRVVLSEPEYLRVAAYIRERQRSSPLWHAVLYNCNAWVADVARYMGLQAPTNTLLYPADFINALAALNTNTTSAGAVATASN